MFKRFFKYFDSFYNNKNAILKGIDEKGNKFFEKNTNDGKFKRYFEPKNEENYDIDIEWESWLRFKRECPPANDEIKQRKNRVEEMSKFTSSKDKNINKFPIYKDLK